MENIGVSKPDARTERPYARAATPVPEVIILSNLRIFQVDRLIFRVDLDAPRTPAQVLRSGSWLETPLPSGDVVLMQNAKEITPLNADQDLLILLNDVDHPHSA